MHLFDDSLTALRKLLTWNKKRVECFVGLIRGVILERTVNMQKLASVHPNSSKRESIYRTLQRFFQKFDLPLLDVSKLILSKIPRPPQGYVLSMDRTNWQLGKRHINILTIGIVVGKVAIPVVWKVLPQSTKKGNSNGAQRKELMQNLLDVIDVEDIHVLLMDREFLGKRWLSWLDKIGVGFVLRVRRNTVIDDKLAWEHASTAGRKTLKKQGVWGMELFFGYKNIKHGRNQQLYVVSNKFGGKDALEWYRRRWSIEVLFGHLKKRGFNLEDTHLTNGKKLEQLMAIVSMSFLFTYGWGLQLRTFLKQTTTTLRRSDFRYALDQITHMLANPASHKELMTQFQHWLTSGKIPVDPKIFVV